MDEHGQMTDGYGSMMDEVQMDEDIWMQVDGYIRLWMDRCPRAAHQTVYHRVYSLVLLKRQPFTKPALVTERPEKKKGIFVDTSASR